MPVRDGNRTMGGRFGRRRQNEGRRRNHRDYERRRLDGGKQLDESCVLGFALDDRPGWRGVVMTGWHRRVVIVGHVVRVVVSRVRVTGEMRVDRVGGVVIRVVIVRVHVDEWRAERRQFDGDGQAERGKPADHRSIIAGVPAARPEELLKFPSGTLAR